jgi:integrase
MVTAGGGFDNYNYDTSLLPREINEAIEGMPKDLKDKVCKLKIQDNALTLSKFIISLKNEINSSRNNNINYARALVKLSNKVDKKFIDITRDDILYFLNSLKKPEQIDPLHKSIGTYNNRLVLISRFFKWLYNPDLEANSRPKPSILDNISQKKRKEVSTYKPSDLWTQEEDLLFLKYCPSKRDRACHMIFRDTSCRPHEILGLRIKDISFKMAGDRVYAEALVMVKQVVDLFH